LHAPKLDTDGSCERVGHERLGHAGNALEQHVTADRNGREEYFDDMVLADHDLPYFAHH
jgi:hypothetical protein